MESFNNPEYRKQMEEFNGAEFNKKHDDAAR